MSACDKEENCVDLTLHIRDDVQRLWDLDTLGIRGEDAHVTKEVFSSDIADKIVSEMQRDDEGRYKVTLPWNAMADQLSDNYEIAKLRLAITTNKLKRLKMYEAYDEVFQEWKKEGIIEVVEDGMRTDGRVHYLPHRPVIRVTS